MAKVFSEKSEGMIDLEHREDLNLFTETTWNLTLRDKVQREELNQFQQYQTSSYMFLIVHICISLYFLFTSIAAHHNYLNGWTIANLIVAVSVPVFAGWCVVLLSGFSTIGSALPNSRLRSLCENVWAFGVTLSYGLSVLVAAHHGRCRSGEFGRRFGCDANGSSDPDAPSHSSMLPGEMMVVLLMLPLLTALVRPSVRWEVVAASFAVAVGVLAFCIGFFDLALSAGPFVVYALMAGVLLFEWRRQSLVVFLLYRRQHLAARDSERTAAASTATEMRHMIGNVAHDLKTPLTAFASGVDLMATVLGEIRGNFLETTAIPFVAPRLQALQECAEHVRGVNSFMTMSVNRCMDFAKASNGLSLVPQLDSLCLADAINLPLGCVRGMMQAGKVAVALHAISQNIAANIITDKQWLQENLLCLLSNAVKYSTRGTISVTLVLVEPPTSSRDVHDVNSKHGGGAGAEDLRAIHEQDLSSRSSSSSSAAAAADAASLERSIHSVTRSVHRRGSAGTGEHRSSLDTIGEPVSGARAPGATGGADARLQELTAAILRESQAMNPSVREPLLRVEVEDSGIGLGDDEMHRLFRPFEQAQRHAGGTGLGLFALARRMEALGGYYGVQRRRDGQQGSLFWFEIPYRPDRTRVRNSVLNVSVRPHEPDPLFQSTDLAPRQAGGWVSAAARPATPRTLSVLVVDDSLAILKMSGMLLRRQGHEVSTAENGAVAVDLVSDRRAAGQGAFDVVLMDLQMPVMDGLEATRRIRQSELSSASAAALPSAGSSAAERPVISGEAAAFVSNKVGGSAGATTPGRQRSVSSKQFPEPVLASPSFRVGGLLSPRRASIAEIYSPTATTSSGTNINTSSTGKSGAASNPLPSGKRRSVLQLQVPPARSPSFDPVDFARYVDAGGSGTPTAAATGRSDAASPSGGHSTTFIRRKSTASICIVRPATPSQATTDSSLPNSPETALQQPASTPVHRQLIIGVSACGDAETVRAAFAAGIDAFTPKPFTLATFTETYERVLRLRTEEEEGLLAAARAGSEAKGPLDV